MAMMEVREVGMAMAERGMFMGVGMRLALGIVWTMLMPVMFVMNMAVVVFQRFVKVLVLMSLSDMKIDADAHQNGRHDQPACDGIA